MCFFTFLTFFLIFYGTFFLHFTWLYRSACVLAWTEVSNCRRRSNCPVRCVRQCVSGGVIDLAHQRLPAQRSAVLTLTHFVLQNVTEVAKSDHKTLRVYLFLICSVAYNYTPWDGGIKRWWPSSVCQSVCLSVPCLTPCREWKGVTSWKLAESPWHRWPDPK